MLPCVPSLLWLPRESAVTETTVMTPLAPFVKFKWLILANISNLFIMSKETE
jgi:hypothetical protein